jgi:hypothetical protein
MAEDTASFADYQDLLADRPTKFGPEEVDYEEASGPERCRRCIHFFENLVRPASTCEIVRLEGDKDIKADWVCKFWTADGEEFPLLSHEKEEEESEEEETKHARLD